MQEPSHSEVHKAYYMLPWQAGVFTWLVNPWEQAHLYEPAVFTHFPGAHTLLWWPHSSTSSRSNQNKVQGLWNSYESAPTNNTEYMGVSVLRGVWRWTGTCLLRYIYCAGLLQLSVNTHAIYIHTAKSPVWLGIDMRYYHQASLATEVTFSQTFRQLFSCEPQWQYKTEGDLSYLITLRGWVKWQDDNKWHAAKKIF